MPKMNFEEKVAAGFEEAGDRMDQIDGKISETAEAIKSMREQVRKIHGALL